MATFEDLKVQMSQNNDAIEAAGISAEEANIKLDEINVKIDDLRAQVNAGGVVTQAQLDELAGLASTAAVSTAGLVVSLQGITTDVADAEQS